MILVAGESLVDLLIRPDGSIYPSPGGGPFNAARTMSRLGQPTRFLGHFSADPFGGRLADRLRQDKVEITLADPVPDPPRWRSWRSAEAARRSTGFTWWARPASSWTGRPRSRR